MSQTARPQTITLGMSEDDFGPAMRELSEAQRAFVIAYAEQGGVNGAEAARKAGYGNNAMTSAQAAYLMLRKRNILDAIREVADERLRAGAILAASVLVEVADSKFDKNRFKSAVELLNRAGLVVEGVSRVIVEDNRTNAQIERRVVDLANKLGIDPMQLLGRAEATDADYEVIDGSGGMEKTVKAIRARGEAWEDEQLLQDQAELDAMLGLNNG